MNKIKLTVLGGATVAAAIVSILAAHATTALTVSCNAGVSGNQVAWTATSSGGNPPVAFLWSGDSKVAGSTSTSISATYPVNGTYTAVIQATDTSSSVATSSCQATVTSNPAPTGTLNVFLSVNGGSAVPANFTVTVSGANATPASFSGNASGTAVIVNASSGYAIGVSPVAGYAAATGGNCTGPIAAGANASCTITENYSPVILPPPVTIPAMLNITPSGQFHARGMTVTAVASGSFQGTIWGISYTVNWSGSAAPEFLFRDDDNGSFENPSAQVAVGDVVGVSGHIDPTSPLVVNANVVRDFTITSARPHDNGEDANSEGENGNGNHNGNGNGRWFGFPGNIPAGVSSSVSSSADIQSRLNDLLNRLHGLQGWFFHGNGRGNGGGEGNGGGNQD